MTTRANNNPAIELDRMTKRFDRTLAVEELSVQIARGSAFGLIGPNGAGENRDIRGGRRTSTSCPSGLLHP